MFLLIIEINKIALSLNNDNIIESIDSTVTSGYEESKEIVCKKEKVQSNDTIKQYKNL